jgi:hypothetical protein
MSSTTRWLVTAKINGAAGIAGRWCACCARCAIPAALIRPASPGCGGSRRPLRRSHPRRQTEIIEESGAWPILPILQTMFGARKGVDIVTVSTDCSHEDELKKAKAKLRRMRA